MNQLVEKNIPTIKVTKTYVTFLMGLVALYVCALLLTVDFADVPVTLNVLGYQTLILGGIFIFPLTFSLLDIVSETYGIAIARQIILIGAIAEIIVSLVSIGIAHLPHPDCWNLTTAYEAVFDPTFRFVFASVIGTIVAELINSQLIFKWKLKWAGNWFIVRSLVSTAIGQALLTVVVGSLAFWHTFELSVLKEMMITGYLWKMLYAVMMAVPSMWLVQYLKCQQIDSFEEVKITFNPFNTQS